MKKIKICLVLVLFFVLNITKAQDWKTILQNNQKSNVEIDFFTIQKAFRSFEKEQNIVKGELIAQNGENQKVPGWKQFKRWEYFWEQRVNPITGEFPKYNYQEKLEDYQKSKQLKNSISGNWQSLGSDFSYGGYAGLGRINCIAFHPSDTSTYWVGSPSGGIWKTSNDGESWTVLSDNNPVLGVSDIVVPSDYETSQTLYIATGDRDGGSVFSLGGSSYDNNSVGVLKSTDGGQNWNSTGLSFNVSDTYIIGRLLIHPTDNNILYAATTAGFYKTTNGGIDWTSLSGLSFIDVEFQPGNPNVMYASTQSWSETNIYKSVNAGTSWSLVKSVNGRRTELAVSAAEPNSVFAIIVNSDNGLEGVYKSVDQGDNFSALLTGVAGTTSCLSYYSNGSGDNTGQGDYDLALAVDPNDANKIYFGGVNSWRSLDGGTTWEIMNMWTSSSSYNFSNAPEVHADKHSLKFRNNSSRLFETNDGGVYKATTDGNLWVDKTNGIAINQIYRLSVAQTVNEMVLTGLQDNGSKMLYNGNWSDVTGGDGMDCKIDYSDESVQYATYAEGTLYRTTNSWTNRTTISDNVGDGTLTGAWVTPFVLHPSDPQTLYLGFDEVWKSTDRGSSFTAFGNLNLGEKIKVLEISASNPSKLIAGSRSEIYLTANEGASWLNITSNLPVSNSSITDVLFKNNDENTLWVTMGSYSNAQVYKSTDGGLSYVNLSQGLPALPAMQIIQNIQNTTVEELYLATDLGIYVKYGDSDWQLFSKGLPNVLVTDLDIYYDTIQSMNSKIYAATFGRGVWVSDLFDNTGIENPQNFSSYLIGDIEIGLAWNLNTVEDTILLAFSESGIFGTPDTTVDYAVGSLINGGGEVLSFSKDTSYLHTNLSENTPYYYKIWSKSTDGKYSSGSVLQLSTLCGALSLPFSEDFSGAIIPDCWEEINSAGVSSRWKISQTDTAGGTANELKVSYENVQNASTRMVLPKINCEQIRQLDVSLDYFFDAYDTGVQFVLQASEDKVNWIDIDTIIESSILNVGPKRDTLSFEPPFGAKESYFSLSLIGDLYAFDDVYIDNIYIEAIYGSLASPQWSKIPDQTIFADESFVDIDLKNYVTDDSTSVQNLVYNVSGQDKLNVSILNGVASISVIDALWLGSDTILFEALDESGLSSKISVVFTVLKANEAPVVTTIEPQIINQGEEFNSIILDDYVTDDYTLDENIIWGVDSSEVFSISIDNRVLQISPKDRMWFGVDTVLLSAKDEHNKISSLDLVLKVNYLNYPPEIGLIESQTIQKGAEFLPIYLNALVSDDYTADTAIVWSILGAQNLSVLIENQVATISVIDMDWIGEEQISFVATDEENASDTASAIFKIEGNVGINKVNSQSEIRIFPNPTQGKFEIQTAHKFVERTTVSIFDLMGKLIYRKTFTPEDEHIIIYSKDIDSGTYIVRIGNEKGSITIKLIVN